MDDYYFDSMTECKRRVRSAAAANFALSIFTVSPNF